MSKDTPPGSGNTAAGIFYLAESYFEAALIVQREHRHPFTDHPARMLFLHAAECYFRACLRAADKSPVDIRSYNHDLAAMARDCGVAGMDLPAATVRYFAGVTESRDYVVVRYDFELRDRSGHRSKKLADLIEATGAVREAANAFLVKHGWPSLREHLSG